MSHFEIPFDTYNTRVLENGCNPATCRFHIRRLTQLGFEGLGPCCRLRPHCLRRVDLGFPYPRDPGIPLDMHPVLCSLSWSGLPAAESPNSGLHLRPARFTFIAGCWFSFRLTLSHTAGTLPGSRGANRQGLCSQELVLCGAMGSEQVESGESPGQSTCGCKGRFC